MKTFIQFRLQLRIQKIFGRRIGFCLPLKHISFNPLNSPGNSLFFSHKSNKYETGGLQFNFPNISLQQYDGVWDGLRASGNAHPRGLISHVGAATPDGGLLVVDVWESEEAFNEFGKTLLPLIARQNISMVSPKIFPAHYVQVEHTEIA